MAWRGAGFSVKGSHAGRGQRSNREIARSVEPKERPGGVLTVTRWVRVTAINHNHEIANLIEPNRPGAKGSAQ